MRVENSQCQHQRIENLVMIDMDKNMNLIYIGDEFYSKSGTVMSSIYTEDGERYDWGFVQIALRNGEDIHIRQANNIEMQFYNKKLQNIVMGKNKCK